ncbi:hypothetical protein WR25_22885 [Diploscapter pachys]|uniref:PHD-type domain-containing protein n=1 Tax=Diploscapter pachys TaxID=2018661 RepID=A0A2A2KTL7_9BILA|nr:hypothetical protein WR25_22885 [Diploscapter pachys]
MAAKLTPDQELWDSGDELGDGKPLQRKGTMPERIKTRPGEIAATTMTVGEALKRPLQMKKIEAEPRDKIRKLEGSEAAEFIIESTTNKKCSECKEGASTSTNAILGCEGCKTAYHMNCHKPPILPKEAADDRFLFLCSKCNTKPSAAHTSSSRSQSPKPRKEDDANKNEKSSAPKSDKAKVGKSTSNIAATFEEFRKKSKADEEFEEDMKGLGKSREERKTTGNSKK